MLLVVDVGNTNITFGIFENDGLIEVLRLSTDKNLPEKEYKSSIQTLCSKYRIKNCVIGSVVDELSLKIKNACDAIFNVNSFLIDDSINLGMKIDLKNPKEVGADRIANAYGAKNKYKLPAIVIDIGTATTFDIISKNGDFLGGIIMPGLNLQFKSLYSNTSKLPQLQVNFSQKAIGKSTEDAILSGIMRGTACAIEGLINQCELELGERVTIIATGGDSNIISEYMRRKFDYTDMFLTLEGLKMLYELNK